MADPLGNKKLRSIFHSWNAQKGNAKRKRKLTKLRRHGAFGLVKNAKLAAPVVIGRAHDLVFPEKLNLISDYKDAIIFFEKLRKLLFSRRVRHVNLDHRGLKEISPEAALMLLAEFFRSHQADSRKVKTCICPTDPTVCWVLHEIGYFNYFPGMTYPRSAQPRGFLHHFHDRRTSGVTVKALIEHFEKRVTFTPDGRRTLYNALVESMNNVAEHAYPWKHGKKWNYREWWLLGFFDDEAREISFSFYDQGLGIPNTIRTRLRDKIRPGSALIRDAVEHGISRTRLLTRGKGLPSLKKYVDASAEGTLVISSHKSQCIFHKGDEPLEQTWNIPLPGTLITWNIRAGKMKE